MSNGQLILMALCMSCVYIALGIASGKTFSLRNPLKKR